MRSRYVHTVEKIREDCNIYTIGTLITYASFLNLHQNGLHSGDSFPIIVSPSYNGTVELAGKQTVEPQSGVTTAC